MNELHKLYCAIKKKKLFFSKQEKRMHSLLNLSLDKKDVIMVIEFGASAVFYSYLSNRKDDFCIIHYYPQHDLETIEDNCGILSDADPIEVKIVTDAIKTGNEMRKIKKYCDAHEYVITYVFSYYIRSGMQDDISSLFGECIVDYVKETENDDEHGELLAFRPTKNMTDIDATENTIEICKVGHHTKETFLAMIKENVTTPFMSSAFSYTDADISEIDTYDDDFWIFEFSLLDVTFSCTVEGIEYIDCRIGFAAVTIKYDVAMGKLIYAVSIEDEIVHPKMNFNGKKECAKACMEISNQLSKRILAEMSLLLDFGVSTKKR